MNQRQSIAVTRTTRWSLPPADLEAVVLEAAQHWVPLFAPRGTVLATVRCFLSRKQTRLKKGVGRQLHCPQVLSNGAQPDATSGSIRVAATIQCAEKEVAVTKERAGGLTTSQVL